MREERRSDGGEWTRSSSRARAGIALAVALAIAVAAATVAHQSFTSARVHVAIETACAVIAVLSAYLMVGRYMFSLTLRDLALIGALTALAMGNIAFSAVPGAPRGGHHRVRHLGSAGGAARRGRRLRHRRLRARRPDRVAAARGGGHARRDDPCARRGGRAGRGGRPDLPTDFGTGAANPERRGLPGRAARLPRDPGSEPRAARGGRGGLLHARDAHAATSSCSGSRRPRPWRRCPASTTSCSRAWTRT